MAWNGSLCMMHNIDNQRSITVGPASLACMRSVACRGCMCEQPCVQGLAITACIFLLECYKVFTCGMHMVPACLLNLVVISDQNAVLVSWFL
jgi:hypothetical protein